MIVSPLVLASLQWVPVHFRMDFNSLWMTYQALNGLAPETSQTSCSLVPSRSLRFRDDLLLVVSQSRLVYRSDRVFSSVAPKLS